jgi:hypothetical protein
VDIPEVEGRVGRVWDEHAGVEEYITIRRQTIAVYVVTLRILIECRQGKRKRGAVPHRWWREQQMDLDVSDAIGSDE